MLQEWLQRTSSAPFSEVLFSKYHHPYVLQSSFFPTEAILLTIPCS